MSYPCANCGLPDPYNGDGDGIGSCECPRCEDCGAAPLMCQCEDDYPWGDDYDPKDPYTWTDPPVVTVEVPGVSR